MGLLEKAGQIQDEGASKSKPTKTKSAKTKSKAPKPKRQKTKKQKVDDDLDDLEVKEKVIKSLPNEFQLAKKPARFARSLVDFICTYGAFLAVLGTFAFVDGDFTYLWIVALLVMLFNMFVMPIMTNRTIGNYCLL